MYALFSCHNYLDLLGQFPIVAPRNRIQYQFNIIQNVKILNSENIQKLSQTILKSSAVNSSFAACTYLSITVL